MNFSPEETNSNSSPIIALKNQTPTILFPSNPPIINNSTKEQKKTDFNIINSISNDNVINSNSNSNKIIYNTGRWSEEEHLKFIDGILEYGNEWKKVQNLIGTRSSTQARSHAQKFFLRLKKNFNLDNEILSESNSTAVSPVNNSCNINDENGNYMKNFFELIYKNKKDKKIKNEKLTLEQKKKIIHLVSKISLHENNDNINIKNNNNNENVKKNDLNFDFNKNSMIKIKINDEDDYKIIDNSNNHENIENKMNENSNNKNKKIFKIKKEKNKKNSIHKKFDKKMSFDYNYHYENLLKNDNEDDLYALGKKRKNNNNDFDDNNSENNNFFNRHRYNSVEVNSNYLFHNFFDEIKNNPFDINFSIDNFNYNNNININNSNLIIEENITSNSNNNLISNNNLDNFKL